MAAHGGELAYICRRQFLSAPMNSKGQIYGMLRFGRLTDNDSIARVVENTFLKTKQFEVPATENKDAWICTGYFHYDVTPTS